MARRKMKVIPYLPGRWLDFDGNNVVIREADGTLVADNLMITEEDAEKLKQKVLEMIAKGGYGPH